MTKRLRTTVFVSFLGSVLDVGSSGGGVWPETGVTSPGSYCVT